MSSKELPSTIGYLGTYLEFLGGLDAEEVNEDTDVIALDDAVREQVTTYGAGWKAKLARDADLLEEWMEETSPANDVGFFVLSFLENFEKDQKTVAALMQDTRERKSDLHLSSEIEGATLLNEFSTLSIQWDDGLYLSLNTLEGLDSFLHHKRGQEHHRGKEENQIAELVLGKWEVTRLILQSSKPFFWKQAQYLLKSDDTFLLGTSSNGGKKDFDVSRVDAVIHVLES